MKLIKIYNGVIPLMQNTPCKIAIFADDKNIKVFEKPFFKNAYGCENWGRNVILEGLHGIKTINDRLIEMGFIET